MTVFDTSIIISAAHGDKKAIAALEEYSKGQEAAITIFNKYELLRGRQIAAESTLTELIDSFKLYYFGDKELEEAVRLFKDLQQRGKMMSEFDLLIAGIALANNETLVTADSDFKNVLSSRIVFVNIR